MKYIIIGVVVIALIAAGFWAGKKSANESPTSTPSVAVNPNPISSQAGTPVSVYTPSTTPTPGGASVPVGNRVGNRAPDFRLKDMEGRDVSLRDYLGREAVKLEFQVLGQLTLRPTSVPQGIVLRDPNKTVYYLYGVPSLPYTVNINERGIIR